MRTLDQNKRIWALVGTLVEATGFSRDYAAERMHDICEEIAGRRSSSHLTEDQAGKLIQRLEGIIRTARGKGVMPSPDKQRRGLYAPTGKPNHDPEALATNAQLATLNQLFLDVGIDTDERQIAFCRRVIKSYIPITRADVAKVHEALEAMYVRKFDDVAIDNMVAFIYRNYGHLTRWERSFIEDILNQIKTKKYRKMSSGKLKKLLEINVKIKRLDISI